jgi:hypothetical protein
LPPTHAGSVRRFQAAHFSPAEVAFALAWAAYAPGLGGWSVEADFGEAGAELLLVDPPLVYGDGFRISRDGHEVVISWAADERRVSTLREAMLLICPLSPDALAAVEALIATSEPTL